GAGGRNGGSHWRGGSDRPGRRRPSRWSRRRHRNRLRASDTNASSGARSGFLMTIGRHNGPQLREGIMGLGGDMRPSRRLPDRVVRSEELAPSVAPKAQAILPPSPPAEGPPAAAIRPGRPAPAMGPGTDAYPLPEKASFYG